MIRLIASDMDGTLVNGEQRVSERCAEAIRSAQRLGAEFIVTTGRSYAETAPQLEAAGVTCNYLVMNGSELRDSTGAVVQTCYLDRDVVERCVKKLENEGVYIELYTTIGICSVSSTEQIRWAVATKINHFVPQVSMRDAYNLAVSGHEEYTKIKRLASLDELWLQNGEVAKIVTFSADRQKLDRLRCEIAEALKVNAACSFPINLEVTDLNASKGRALKAYAASREVSLDDVMTIGDNYNDLSMLGPEFGYPVAMGNAPDDVKAFAKHVTSSNLEDGVARAIDELVLHS